jgi:AAA+ ATPase superfamily predicted ATPase
MKIIGRVAEQKALKEFYLSDRAEFVAIYGRRRVGKTFLIREFFKNNFAFHLTGLANAPMQKQFQNFNTSLNNYAKTNYPATHSWLESFEQLIDLLEKSSSKGKKVIFLDELPWMDTHKSGFITALEHFWNDWASSRQDILLIVCGSATSWMINKLIKNHGGLHNRITKRIYLEPFTLGECEAYYKAAGIVMSRYQMIESYMILGGIPYYLSLMDKGLSLSQNIDKLIFSPNGILQEEFGNLYASLFKYSDNHIKVVEALSKKTKGLTREEIIRLSKIADGGGLTKTLEELEQCSFIRKYNAFEKKRKQLLYQLTDFYTLFYFNFVKGNKYNDENFWTNATDNPKRRAWSGYSFEQLCLSHVKQIKYKLGIAGVLTSASSWRSEESTPGAQIDLLLDRNDHVINICEMKFANAAFVIDKKYDENLRNKKDCFARETKTKKALHITMVTTYGIKKNEYSGNIQSEIVMDDLF